MTKIIKSDIVDDMPTDMQTVDEREANMINSELTKKNNLRLAL